MKSIKELHEYCKLNNKRIVIGKVVSKKNYGMRIHGGFDER